MENPMTHSNLVINLHKWLAEHHNQMQSGIIGLSVGAHLERRLQELYDIRPKKILRYKVVNDDGVFQNELSSSEAMALASELKTDKPFHVVSYERDITPEDLM